MRESATHSRSPPACLPLSLLTDHCVGCDVESTQQHSARTASTFAAHQLRAGETAVCSAQHSAAQRHELTMTVQICRGAQSAAAHLRCACVVLALRNCSSVISG